MKGELTVAAVGDCVVTQPFSEHCGFQPMAQILRKAQFVFGNFEGSLINPQTTSLCPQSDFGTGIIVGSAKIAEDFKHGGFDLLCRANNHATDFGLEGMQLTSKLLNKAGLLYAGIGLDSNEARAPILAKVHGYRIAVVSVTSTFPAYSRASAPFGSVPARPGVNAIRIYPYVKVLQSELATVMRIAADKTFGPSTSSIEAKSPSLCGLHFKPAGERGLVYEVHSRDKSEILSSIARAKSSCDLVICSIHSHEPGNWSSVPANFFPDFAREVIDAGADFVCGHGPHRIRGIEIYRGCPICYSLGNFIFQLDYLSPPLSDYYEQFRTDLPIDESELRALWHAAVLADVHWYQGLAAVLRVSAGKISELELVPLELEQERLAANYGLPKVASIDHSVAILRSAAELSLAFGTHIHIEGRRGVIDMSESQ